MTSPATRRSKACMSSIAEVLSESLEQPLDAAAGARRADARRDQRVRWSRSQRRSASRAALGRPDRGGPAHGEDRWRRHPPPGRCHPARPMPSDGDLDLGSPPSLAQERLASLTATAMSQDRSRAGSRTLPIFFQAMTHAACVASSASGRSRITYRHTRRMSSWCAAMMRRKAYSSPAAADAIRSPASC